ADRGVLGHRRTRAGDAHESGTKPSTPGIGLGMPGIGAPKTEQIEVAGCGL
ncbi:tRNA (N6-isopentenyl adenosine(37)-C2)-methylthiotransferase MiaB, partial [Clostridioides difficile]|nr:tRNA (N6-isopentenyl adenosine(37)-C2)-methylthiotransferase MiaB [Clostridioides difficile]